MLIHKLHDALNVIESHAKQIQQVLDGQVDERTDQLESALILTQSIVTEYLFFRDKVLNDNRLGLVLRAVEEKHPALNQTLALGFARLFTRVNSDISKLREIDAILEYDEDEDEDEDEGEYAQRLSRRLREQEQSEAAGDGYRAGDIIPKKAETPPAEIPPMTESVRIELDRVRIEKDGHES